VDRKKGNLPIEETAGHVLSIPGVALDHLVLWLEASIGDFRERHLFVVSLLRGNDWRVSHEWKVDAGIWNQVGLKLCEINVEGAIETE